MTNHVFVSYAREDQSIAERIASKLADAGFVVWFDKNISGSESYVQQINAAVEASAAVIVLWSAHSVASSFVIAEAKRALDRGVLVPVAIAQDVRPPIPFNTLQMFSLPTWHGEADDPAFMALCEMLRSLVDASRQTKPVAGAPNPPPLPTPKKYASLVGMLVGSRSEAADLVEDRTRALQKIAERLELKQLWNDLEDERARVAATEFKIVVVGRMKTGKSSFLNCLLGSGGGIGETDPLPIDDLPCTAVLTHINYGPRPKIVANYFDSVPEPWDFAKYAKVATIYSEDPKDVNANRELLKRVSMFEMLWPADLLKLGVTLIDSPGIDDDHRRTDITRSAIRSADAAIFMHRTDVLATQSDVQFMEHEVRPRAGAVFILINRWEGRIVDARLKNVLYERLDLDRGRTLDDQGVFLVDVKGGRTAKSRVDPIALEASGLAEFEQRLGSFLVHEKLDAVANKCLKQAAQTGHRLNVHIDACRIALTAEAERLSQALAACQQDVDNIRRRQRSIDLILKGAEIQVGQQATQSYAIAIGEIVRTLPKRLEQTSLPFLDGVTGKASALFKNQQAVEQTITILLQMAKSDLESWAEAEPPAPGLARDLDFILTSVAQNVEREFEEIERSIVSLRGRVSALAPTSVSQPGEVLGLGEQILAAGAAFAVLGPLGAVLGAGGIRGLAGGLAAGMGAYLALWAASSLVAFPVAAVVGIIWAAVFGGGAFAALTGMEDRIKKKALEAFLPKLQDHARDPTVHAELQQQVATWFSQTRKTIDQALERIVQSEQEALVRLKSFEADRANREHNLAMLKATQAELADVMSRLPAVPAPPGKPAEAPRPAPVT